MTRHTANALARLLNTRVWDYGCDFNDLWGMKDLGEHVIVVWSDSPADASVHPVDTERHLTPLDWALAARTKHKKLQVTLIDLRSRQRDEDDDELAAKELPAAYEALRWLRAQVSVPWLQRLGCEELAAAVTAGDLRALMKINSTDPSLVRPEDVLLSLPICRVDPSPDANHHSIANLIGPMLLGFAPAGAEGLPDHRAAVRRILETARLLPEGNVDDDERKAARKRAFACCEDFKNVLLVDDMADFGWADFARSFWPTGLTVQKSPDELITSITTKTAPGHASGVAYDLILLDLRLTTNEAAAAKLLEELRKLVPKDSGLWEGRKIVAPAQDDSGEELTLLARLLANAFPDLPIILFSTTMRRDIVARLRLFDNIITEFGKPRLAEGEQGALRALEGFGRALDSALAIKRAADLVASLVSVANGESPRIGAGAKVVDILLDESGKLVAGDVSVIAGILFEYEESETAMRIASDLDEGGHTWGLSRDILEKKSPKVNKMGLPVLEKVMKADQQQTKLKLMTEKAFKKTKIRAIGIILPNAPAPGPASVFADAEYRQYLGILLELLIADLVDPTATIHIDVATRLREVPDEKERKRQLDQFGRRTAYDDCIFALNPEEVHPITDNIAWRRGIQPPTVARASTIDNRFLWVLSAPPRNGCFFQLNPKANRVASWQGRKPIGSPDSQHELLDKKRAHPRQVHYLADWVAGAGRKVAQTQVAQTATTEVPVIDGWYSDGFLVNGDATLDKMLTGLRSGSLKPRSPDRIAEAVQLCGEAVQAWRAAPSRFPMLTHLAAPLAEIARAAAETAVRKALHKRMARVIEDAEARRSPEDESDGRTGAG